MNGHGRGYQIGNRFFRGDSRSEKRANSNLGVIATGYGVEKKHYRDTCLKVVDDYLNGEQYDGLADWDSGAKLKNKKPKIIFPFAKIFQDRVSSKLVGHSTFPRFKIEEDEDSEYFLNKVIIPETYFKSKMLSLSKDLILRTSAFMRYRFVNGSLRFDKYNSNYCYPVFDGTGELESVEIKYVYETDEFDSSTGKMVRRWFKLEMNKMFDTLYDNPVYKENTEPEFEITEVAEHGFGFVQGQWFRLGENSHSADGEEYPIIYQMKDWIDCLNYNLSLSDKATNYGTEPQLVINGMTEDDVEGLIKNVSKTWLLGQEGEAKFIETANSGVTTAKEQRDDYLRYFQYITRLVLLDPEKMVGSAQSAKAMEVLHGPLVELINEYRPYMERGMKMLLQKIAFSIVTLENSGFDTQFVIPEGWFPKSLDMATIWPPIFEMTTQDKQQLLSIGLQASNGNIIARDTALRWIQSQGLDFGVEDFELEVEKINNQKNFNAWGGF